MNGETITADTRKILNAWLEASLPVWEVRTRIYEVRCIGCGANTGIQWTLPLRDPTHTVDCPLAALIEQTRELLASAPPSQTNTH